MQCTNPFRIKNPNRFKYTKVDGSLGPEWLEVPCGHCLSCRIARSREWAVRLLHESENWEDCVFLTLTYSPENLPLNGSLVPQDLTKFFKRLRRDIPDRKIKYFACGEYGDNYQRPHYHAIVFGLSVRDYKLVDENWNFGFVKVGTVTYESCRYVAGYVQKKLYGEGASFYEENGLVPPFSRCSKGIGSDYIEKHWNQLYFQEKVTVGGVNMGLPRYYKKKLDYDGFLSYDVDRQRDIFDDFLFRNSDAVNHLDYLVQSGEMSVSRAREELSALFNSYKMDCNANKDKRLSAKEERFKREKF